jgi:hypothetical protein
MGSFIFIAKLIELVKKFTQVFEARVQTNHRAMIFAAAAGVSRKPLDRHCDLMADPADIAKHFVNFSKVPLSGGRVRIGHIGLSV